MRVGGVSGVVEREREKENVKQTAFPEQSQQINTILKK